MTHPTFTIRQYDQLGHHRKLFIKLFTQAGLKESGLDCSTDWDTTTEGFLVQQKFDGSATYQTTVNYLLGDFCIDRETGGVVRKNEARNKITAALTKANIPFVDESHANGSWTITISGLPVPTP